MPEPLDAYRYISYLRSRWVWILASCAIAATIAVAVTLLVPREYTATARIVIEPPAGTDLRAAMTVSPIYLESLKTYEQLALSDSLFQKAIERFGLRSLLGPRPIESMKKRVLNVGLVRNTRILEIAASLPDARKAQELALFLAESTVELNRSLGTEGDRDLLAGVEQQERELNNRMQQIDTAWARLLASEPVDDLQSAMDGAGEMRTSIQEQAQNVELEIADWAAREKQGPPAAELGEIRKEAANAQARLAELRRQSQALDRRFAEQEKLLAERLAHRDKMEAERKAAQTALEAIETRLREARGDAGYRGERLRIIDPGIVPERPSSPNLPLNVMAALLLGLVLPVLYFTLEMSYREQRYREPRSVYHAVSKARDE
ncbi:MAG TPA: Wzz/FepE/Etk N-terminal domain-containing protein [Bryobacteraceae bacterium]|nr:Wzz/FepE/Etk N-terminal domain-containing protein [Bryobacteraceae bacterium]